MCRDSFKANRVLFSHLGVPIITTSLSVLDRTIILKKIKNLSNMISINLNLLNTKKQSELLDLFNKNQIVKNYIDTDPLVIEILNFYNKKLKYIEKLKIDDFYTRRINVSINKKRYQLRVQNKSLRKLNFRKMKIACAPNSTHAIDASILFAVTQHLSKYNIKILCIHDSIGSNLELMPLII